MGREDDTNAATRPPGRARSAPRVPDHARTERILSMVGELLREPACDQLRIGQLLEVVRPVPGPDLFFIEDGALEAALAARLAEVRDRDAGPDEADAAGPKP